MTSAIVAIKPPARQLDWVGKRVRPTRPVQTAIVMIPAGRLGTITSVSGGLIAITFDGCECCGVAARLTWKRINDPKLMQFVSEGII